MKQFRYIYYVNGKKERSYWMNYDSRTMEHLVRFGNQITKEYTNDWYLEYREV